MTQDVLGGANEQTSAKSIAGLADPELRLGVAALVEPRHQAEVGPHVAAPFEARGILNQQLKRECRQRAYAHGLREALRDRRFWTIWGSIALLLQSRWAPRLFVAQIVIVLLTNAYEMALGRSLLLAGGPVWGSTAFLLAVLAGQVLYARYLHKRGLLD